VGSRQQQQPRLLIMTEKLRNCIKWLHIIIT
jgi:hypothetical protein